MAGALVRTFAFGFEYSKEAFITHLSHLPIERAKK